MKIRLDEEWISGDETIIKLLRYFYYDRGLLSLVYYEKGYPENPKYIAYINKNYATWKNDLEFIKNYCRSRGIEVETIEDEKKNIIYLKFKT